LAAFAGGGGFLLPFSGAVLVVPKTGSSNISTSYTSHENTENTTVRAGAMANGEMRVQKHAQTAKNDSTVRLCLATASMLSCGIGAS
jgi:hypothetical protein